MTTELWLVRTGIFILAMLTLYALIHTRGHSEWWMLLGWALFTLVYLFVGVGP